jgi:hypothetical protein
METTVAKKSTIWDLRPETMDEAGRIVNGKGTTEEKKEKLKKLEKKAIDEMLADCQSANYGKMAYHENRIRAIQSYINKQWL